ncbi:hypothetical protein DSO57_1037090 [Entomophthora muscae]|uniref:Uncharacterized protein n=1 Tax=Entomophthora muscae TaxID=34485 RepID=A0ACC2UJV7_9FUNG|nr:hypothetical protein DSO57_1037090 [Entomophthora muscae]
MFSKDESPVEANAPWFMDAINIHSNSIEDEMLQAYLEGRRDSLKSSINETIGAIIENEQMQDEAKAAWARAEPPQVESYFPCR